jgi:hypothetical protein
MDGVFAIAVMTESLTRYQFVLFVVFLFTSDGAGERRRAAVDWHLHRHSCSITILRSRVSEVMHCEGLILYWQL